MSFGTTYMESPDLFPLRRSGEAWGDAQVQLRLGGIVYRFSGLNIVQREGILNRFAHLCCSEGDEPDIETCLFRVDPSEFRRLTTANRQTSFDFRYEATRVSMVGEGLMALIQWSPGLRGALWSAYDAGAFVGVFENYFRVLVAYRLLESGGALLHSAAVVQRGGVHLLVGRSGAGKTTVARLSLEAGLTVLSDDLNAVSCLSGESAVEPMPFAGDLETPAVTAEQYPLRSICLLRQGTADSVQPVSAGRALSKLLACSPFVNSDPHRFDRLSENLNRLLDQVPARILTFSRQGRIWDILSH